MLLNLSCVSLKFLYILMPNGLSQTGFREICSDGFKKEKKIWDLKLELSPRSEPVEIKSILRRLKKSGTSQLECDSVAAELVCHC